MFKPLRMNTLSAGSAEFSTPLLIACFFAYEAGEPRPDARAIQLDTALAGEITRRRQQRGQQARTGAMPTCSTPLPGALAAQRVLLLNYGPRHAFTLAV